jgi:hypothetical protein
MADPLWFGVTSGLSKADALAVVLMDEGLSDCLGGTGQTGVASAWEKEEERLELLTCA